MKHSNLTAHQIETLVAAFYEKVRSHEILGPIFTSVIGTEASEWRVHEAKIAAFWRNAVGIDKSYSGNPMIKHSTNPKIQKDHFPVWLALFRETAMSNLPPSAAAEIADLADRIGQSLSFGIDQFRSRVNQPPKLT